MMGQVLYFAIKEAVSTLDVGFLVYVYMMAGFLCIFCLDSDEAIIPWEPTKRADFVAQRFLDS